ncbi:MAG: carboxypeptidase-like regulatory domain-containing protein, partial [Thermocladium sp.]
ITNTTQPFYVLLGLGHAFGVTYESLDLICRKATAGLYLNITAFNEETGKPVPSNITLVTNTVPMQVIGEKTGAYAVFNITQQYYYHLISNYYAYITPLNSTQGGLVIYPISLNGLSQEGAGNNGSQVISIPVSINPSNVRLNLLTVNTVYSDGTPALSNITINGSGISREFIDTSSISINLTPGTYHVSASTACNSTILSKSVSVTMSGEPESITIVFPCHTIVESGNYIVRFKANTTSGSPVYPVTLKLSSSSGSNQVINLGINGAIQVLRSGLTYTWTLLSWNPAYTPEATGGSFALTQNNTIIYILFTKSGSSVYSVFAHVYYRYPNGSLIPIPHAKVSAANLSTTITTFTNANGLATFTGLSPGLYNVSATALNYTSIATITKSVTVTQNDSVDFYFTPPPTKPKEFLVTIHVVNGTGYGLNANVGIYFTNGTLLESLNALDGYAYAYLEQGTYVFKASYNNVSNETTRSINSNATVLIVLPTTQPAPASTRYYPINVTAVLIRNNIAIGRMNVVIAFSMSNKTITSITVNGSRIIYMNGGLNVTWKLASWSPSYDIPLQFYGSFIVNGAGQLMLYFAPPPIYSLTVKVLSLQGQAIPGASVYISNSTLISLLTDSNGKAVINLQGLEYYKVTASYLGVTNSTLIYLSSNMTVVLYLNTTKITTSTTKYYPITFTSQVYLDNNVVGEMSSISLSVAVSNGTKINITASPSTTIYVLGNQSITYSLIKFSPNWFKALSTTGSLKVLGATTIKLSFLEEFLAHTYFISELLNGTIINGAIVRLSMPTGFNVTYTNTAFNITTPYALIAYQGLSGDYTVIKAPSGYTVLNPTGQFLTVNGSVIIYLGLRSSSKETDIIVRVINPVNEPVPNATVTSGTGFIGRTGANGEVSFLAPTGIPVMINATYGKARNSTIITPVGSSYMVTLTLNVNESTPTTLGKQGLLWVYAYDALNNSLIKAPIQVQVVLRNGFGSVVGMNYTINGVATLLYTLYNYYNITGYLHGWSQVNNGYVYLYEPETTFNLIMAPDAAINPPSGNNTLPTLISKGVTYYPLTFLVITRDGFPVQGANITLIVNGTRYVKFTDSSGESTFYFPKGSQIRAIASINGSTLYKNTITLLNGTLIVITANNYSIFYYPFTIIQAIRIGGGPVVFTGLRLNPVLTTLSIWSNVIVNDSILLNETLNSSLVTQLRLKTPLNGNGLQTFNYELPVLVIGNGTLRDAAAINETISVSGNKTVINAVHFYRNPVQSNALNVSGFMTIAAEQSWIPIHEVHPPFTLPGDVGLYALKLLAPPGEIQLIRNSTFSGYLQVPITVVDILTLPWSQREEAGYYSKMLQIGNTTSVLLLRAALGWGVSESYSPILPPGLITLSTTSPLTIPIDPAIRILTVEAPSNVVSGVSYPVVIVLMTNIYGNTITILSPLLKNGGEILYAGNETTIYSIKTQGLANIPWYIFMERINLTVSAPQSAYPLWGVKSVTVTVYNFFLVIILLIIVIIMIAGVSAKAIRHAKHEVLGANRFVKRKTNMSNMSMSGGTRFLKDRKREDEDRRVDKHKSRFLKRGVVRAITLFLLGLLLALLGSLIIIHASTLP